MRVAFIVVICLIEGWTLHAQRVRGFVFETATHKPISQAQVFISFEGVTDILSTDAGGRFTYQAERAGRIDIIVSHLGYELVHLQALQLSAAKDLSLNIAMTARIRELAEVNIHAPSIRRITNRFYATTEEETRRFAATFFDPARMSTLYPGVIAANDQANALVIHGIGPEFMQWYLEGVEIVNPNHLANSGTFSDRASTTGGGVNMLSNQMLASSSLATGALPPQYGNAVSGVMDMHFRRGNHHRYEHTVQAGLLGIELASEGPLYREWPFASYLANYRLSTVGVLSALGVDFGDERIGFQDLNFRMHVPFGKPGASVAVFGAGGTNSNLLEGPKDTADREGYRDISQVDYRAGTAIFGSAVQWPLSAGLLRLASAVSHAASRRDEMRIEDDDGDLADYSDERARQTRWSSRIEWQSQRSNRMTVIAGIMLNRYWINDSGFYPQSGDFASQGAAWLLRPYGQVSYVLTGDLVLRGGLSLSRLTGEAALDSMQSATFVPEPSLRLYWQSGDRLSIEGGFRYSGTFLPQYVFAGRRVTEFDMLRTHALHCIVRHQMDYATQVALIVNYFKMSRVHANADTLSHHTILGSAGYPAAMPLTMTGTGRSMGVSVALRRDIRKGAFLRGGAGWVGSVHRGSAGVPHSTPYDTKWWIQAAGGHEWLINASRGENIIGISGAVQWRGNLREQEIDPDASKKVGYTVYATEGDFAIKQANYLRIDLRMYLRKEKAHRVSALSLDIQNLFGKRNHGYLIYDPYTGDVQPILQLGIVPILSYRVDFN